MSILDHSLSIRHFCRHELRPRRSVHAFMLLAGGSGVQSLQAAAQRSVLDLPLSESETLLSHWREQIQSLNGAQLAPTFRAQIVGGVPVHSLGSNLEDLRRIEHLQDPQEVRGSAGVLRDVTAAFEDDALVLVANAATIVLEPLNELLDELLSTDSDISFFVHGDHTSGGLKLLRCGCLRSIPAVGFVDFKEQALPMLHRASSLAAIRREQAVSSSLRTARDYIRTLRTRRQALAPKAFEETWRPAFRVVEPGADVHASARLHDSVALRGSTVGRDALVVRSIVCPGATVSAGSMVVDQVVQPRRRGQESYTACEK